MAPGRIGKKKLMFPTALANNAIENSKVGYIFSVINQMIIPSKNQIKAELPKAIQKI